MTRLSSRTRLASPVDLATYGEHRIPGTPRAAAPTR